MNILYLIPRTIDATHQQTTENELARAFVKQGHEISTMVGYQSEKIPMDGFTHVYYAHVPKGSLLGKLRYHFKMLAHISGTKYDVIMLGFAVGHLLPFMRLRYSFNKRPVMVLDIRSVPVDVGSNFKGKLLEFRYRLGLLLGDYFSDGFSVITPMLGETVKPRLRRLKYNEMGIWASGVNLDQFTVKGRSKRRELGLENRLVVLYHGILSPNRGIQNAIRAIALLKDEYNHIVFLIVGDGDGMSEMKKIVSDNGLQEQIMFTGQVPYNDIPGYLRAADIGILPFPNITWWAVSSPIKLMEYLSMHVPVVATDIDANRYVLEKTGGGILAADSSAEKLADAIRTIVEEGCKLPDDNLLESTISWNEQARLLIKFFEKISHN